MKDLWIKCGTKWEKAIEHGLMLSPESAIGVPVVESWIIEDVPGRIGVLDLSGPDPIYKHRPILLVLKKPCLFTDTEEEQRKFTKMWHGKTVDIATMPGDSYERWQGKADLSFEWADNVLTLNLSIPYAFPFKLAKSKDLTYAEVTTNTTKGEFISSTVLGPQGGRITVSLTSSGSDGFATVKVSGGDTYAIDMTHKSITFTVAKAVTLTITYKGALNIGVEKMSL